MVELANNIWVDGPTSSPTHPEKWMIRQWGTWVESLVNLAFTNGKVYPTRAALDADLVPSAFTPALVIGNGGNDGLYMKVGATTEGSWTRLTDFVPGTQIVHAVDAGVGTPNAIIATSSISLSSSGSQIIRLDVFEANTGPVTVAFNDAPPIAIKTASGNDPVPGGLIPGAVLGVISGGVFKLLSDLASAAIVAAAEVWANAAEASADASDDAADRSQGYAALAGAALAPLHFATVALLLADAVLSYSTGVGLVQVGTGDIIQARGFRYQVAASGASNHHLTTAGGVKLYVLPNANDQIDFAAFNPGMNSTAGDDTLFVAAVTASRIGTADGVGRLKCREVILPPGILLIDEALQLAPLVGLTGLKVTGAGRDNTIIDFSGAAATIACRHSAYITWQDVTLRSSGIDNEQVGFTVTESGAEGGGTLRTWNFLRVNFYAFFKVFGIGGTIMCSEFTFIDCTFAQCYHGFECANQQAVNWNLYNCRYENESMVTVKDKDEAAIFLCKAGFLSNWKGGSFVYHGKLVKFDLTGAGVWQRVGTGIHFEGQKMELMDNGAAGHAPLLDKVATGYVNGSNYPSVTLKNIVILNNGSIPNTVTQFKLWNGCRFVLENVETEGGKIVGVLDASSPAQPGFLDAREVYGFTYEEDVTARAQTHQQHNVNIRFRGQDLIQPPTVQTRMGDVTKPVIMTEQVIAIRGNTGSLPQAGTSVNLPTLRDHTQLSCIEIERYAAAAQDLTVDLRDQADTTSYGVGTILAAELYKRIAIGRELGYQIPSGTALMLKFTGTAQIIKGVVKVRYI